MGLPKFCYRITEMAESWGCEESDIFNYAALGELQLSYKIADVGWRTLPPGAAVSFADEKTVTVEYQWRNHGPSDVVIHIEDIYLLHKDRMAFEQSVGIHSQQAVLPSPTKAQSERNRKNQSARRMDALGRLADRTYQGLMSKGLQPTCLDVIQNLESFDEEDEVKRTIEEIRYDEGIIYWLDQRGKDRDTPFKAFANRMTRLKKKI